MVERSDSYDGAWGDGSDDDLDQYPAAPVPAHERTWRHPSEVGQAQWVQSEPPVAIGRGLMATTGLVGCALGLAVVWLLVPGGLDQGPIAGPTVTRSVGAVGNVTATTEPLVSLLTPTTAAAQPTSTLPVATVPTHTVAVQTVASASPATAVLIEGTSLLLTTAAAVREQRRVSVEDASAVLHEASVVGASGELVLLTAGDGTGAPVDVVGFESIGRASEGDQVTVLGSTPLQIEYPADGEAIDLGELPDDAAIAAIAEGSPVVDADGVLVALCTHDRSADDGVELRMVPIADVLATLLGDDATGTTTPNDGSATGDDGSVDEAAAGSGWIGLRLAELTDPDGVVVDWVAPDSPAFVAGIAVGEVVRAVDGEVVATVTAVRAVLAGSLPGDTVVLTLWAADGSERQVSVVLGVAAPDV